MNRGCTSTSPRRTRTNHTAVTGSTMSITLILCMLISLASVLTLAKSVEAQAQVPIGWEMGLVDEDASPFEFDDSGKVSISYWIRNDHLVGMEVEIDYDLPFEAGDDGPTSASLGSGENQTISITATISDPYAYDGARVDPFDIEATVTSIGGVMQTGTDTESADGELRIPLLYRLQSDLSPPAGPMNSGTSITLSMTAGNLGNTNDSIGAVSVDDNCPLLPVEGGDAMIGAEVKKGAATLNHELTIEASPSHPDRKCEIEVAIRSKGDGSWARSTVEVEVEVGRSAPDSSDEGGSEDPDDPPVVVQSNLTAAGAPVTLLAALFGAGFSRRRSEASLGG